ncbi:nucleotidyltransferase family protein [Mangrovimonas cancribranchiae]|uniref:Nucleotidyltransferase family protein n=1 Tax=Mangrovimonas cancribranchiae TaxID=3080055 RepID=A0AAU6P220_9FLAO
MRNLAHTYRVLSHIFSREASDSLLTTTLSPETELWDDLVTLASSHLTLPALYASLHSKNLQHLMPNDLNNYLAEISLMNRERNQALLSQINVLSDLFKQHHITHVFLKGSALLVSGIFNDTAERMLGDIDILIAPKQLTEAYALLLDNGYQKPPMTFGVDYFEHKHLPRLLPNELTGIGAVELHSKLFEHHSYTPLIADNILHHKQQIQGFSLPCWEHLLWHNILNWQYNDFGGLTNTLSFRSAYDTVIILNKHPYLLETPWPQNKSIERYFKIMRGYFSDVNAFQPNVNNWHARFYQFKLNYPKLLEHYNRTLKFCNRFPTLWDRFNMFVSNHTYRKLIWQDRKRILRLLFKY